MAEIKLDNEQVDKALHAAILDAIGDLGREQIIKEAIAHLTRKDSYNRTSPLQNVIANAAEKVAKSVLEGRLEQDPEFLSQVEALYADATKRMFDVDSREKMVERLAEKMSRALTEDRY